MEDCEPLAHEGKGNHSHHDRSYNIHITKTGRLVTWNRQHIKLTQISAEQYLCAQLQKHTRTDPLQNILTQLEKQHHTTSISHYTNNAPNHNNITPDQATASEGQDNSQRKEEENNGQKISINKIPINRPSNNKEDGWDIVIKTRYVRVIGKPDRLAH